VSETFTLTATNVGGAYAVGTATILDDGTGDLFSTTNATGIPEAPNTNNLPATLNDDRSLRVNDVTVNEGSPYMVFTVSGISNQAIYSLALANSTSGLIASDSGVDYGASTGTGLEYWDIASGIWVPYVTGSVNLDSTGTLLVRTPIANDTTNDNGETFKLVVTSMSQVAVTGTGTILDNGSGTIFVADDPNTVIDESAPSSINNVLTPPAIPEQTAAVVTPTVSAPLPDDDRPLTVNNVTVNEASPFAVFTVGGIEGQYVKLALGATNTGTDATLTGSAADIGQILEYFNGTGWVTYTSGSYVQIPTDGNATPGQAANLLVRVAVINDALGDSGETFTLTATNTGTLSAVGTGTILDNGTGDIFSGTSGVPDANVPAALLNNDQPVVSITATDATAVEGTSNSTLVFTVAQSNPSTQATDIVVTLNLGTVEAEDITSITYVDASGATVTTTIAALQAGLALTIPATPDGSAPWSPVFTITAAQDAIYEVSEALTMSLALGASETDATLGAAVATGTILDESSTLASDITGGNNLGDKPVVSITATDPTAVEGTTNSTLVFTVAQSNPSTQATDIVVTLNLGTVEAEDITSITYVDASGATVTTTIAALQAGLALTIPATPDGSAPWSPVFTITAAQDAIYEVSEALTMSLALGASETDATLGAAVATGTILDESSTLASDITGGNNLGDKPVVSITATDPTAVEGTTNSTLVFTVSQTNLSTVDTTVLVQGTLGDISAADLTSISYTNAVGTVVTLSTPAEIASFFSTGVTVKIPAGSTVAPVITFTATDDTIFEQSESFSVAISAPVNATLGTTSATGTILDEDSTAPTTKIDAPLGTNPTDTLGDKPVVSITATDPTAVEGTTNSTLVFTVAQSNPSTQATDIVVTLNLGTVEAEDITSITYVDASGATVTTTIAALQAGLALTIPATPDGSTPWSPVFTITAAPDAIYEVSRSAHHES
jgi:hypothetical protein